VNIFGNHQRDNLTEIETGQGSSWLPSWLDKFLVGPFAGALTAVITVLAGATFQDDILTTVLHPWPLYPMFLWKASIFWLTIILVALLMGGTQFARANAAKRARARVDTQVGNLESLVHRIESLPPESFLSRYQELLRQAGSSTFLVLAGQATRQQIESAIRNVLGAIVELARDYDKRIDEAIYAANVMLFRSDGNLEAPAPVSFGALTMPHPEHDGVLELIPALSTTTANADLGPDMDVAPLLIQIPKNKASTMDRNLNPRFPVLPGAAWAFVYCEYAGFPTIAQLDEWLEHKCSASQELIKGIRDYFASGAGKNIKSFASMPILPPSRAAHRLPLGVLNLHSDRDALLAIKGGERFGPLLEPFRLLLSLLLTLRMAHLQPGLGADETTQKKKD
jgi:hypothetical protein